MADEVEGGQSVEETMTTDDFRDLSQTASLNEDYDKEVVEAMRFNPNFEEEPAAPAAPATPEQGTGTPAAPPEGSQPAAEIPAVATPSPEAAQIAGVQTQLTELATQLRGIADTAKAPEVPAPAPNEDPVPDYNMTIPDLLVEKMASEDPEQRKLALAGFAAGVAQVIHRQVMKEAKEFVTIEAPRLAQQQATQDTFQRELFNDFYIGPNGYPQLNRPELRSFVKDTAEKFIRAASEKGFLTNANFRANWPVVKKAIGEEALRMLSGFAPAQAAPATPGGQTAAAVAGTAASPAISPQFDLSKEIMNTLN